MKESRKYNRFLSTILKNVDLHIVDENTGDIIRKYHTVFTGHPKDRQRFADVCAKLYGNIVVNKDCSLLVTVRTVREEQELPF